MFEVKQQIMEGVESDLEEAHARAAGPGFRAMPFDLAKYKAYLDSFSKALDRLGPVVETFTPPQVSAIIALIVGGVHGLDHGINGPDTP